MHPLHRILISLALSTVTYVLISKSEISFLMKSMILWDVFAFTYIVSSWVVFFTCSTQQIRKEASKEDGSRFFVFLVILISSFASMLNVLLLIISKDSTETLKSIYLPVAIAGMLLSRLMVHTTFGFHYAHKYYNNDSNDPSIHAEGLVFPNEKKLIILTLPTSRLWSA